MKLGAVAAVVLALLACGACGDPASDGPPTLGGVDLTRDGDGCIAVATGSDRDGDGVLGDDEVTESSKLCGPVAGSTVRCDSGDGSALTGEIVIASVDDEAKLAGVGCIDGDLLVVGLDDGELPSLAGLHAITGNLAIAGDRNVTTLAALRGVRAVGGALLVQGNDALADLDGATSIAELPELDVLANPHLPDLGGLEAFPCTTALRVADNPELASLTGLDGHTCIGDLALDDNASLDSLDALAQLATAGSLELADNPRLATVALPRLASVGGDVRVGGGAVLELALPALASVGGELDVDDTGLRQLALPALADAGDLDLSGNGELETVDAPGLAVGGDVAVANDRKLVAIRTAITAPHDLSLTALPALSALVLGEISEVAGSLTIEATDLPDLSALALVSRVHGDLALRGNAFGARAAHAFASHLEIDGATDIE